MTERRVELESRLQAIERSEDVVALGTGQGAGELGAQRSDGGEARAVAAR
jgi:hypothetical protein